MGEGQARPAWVASLLIHGVLIALIAGWLLDQPRPSSAPATPLPLTLAMFQPPAAPEAAVLPEQTQPVEATPPAQAVADTVPLAPPAAAALPPKPRPPAKSAPPKPAASASEPVAARPLASEVAAASSSHQVLPAPAESVAPPPAAPLLTLPADPALEDGYRARIRQAIDAHKHYPRMARRLGLEGRVVVSFTVKADGRLAETRVIESSGSEILDEAALEAVRQAAPFPPFPAGIERRQWVFTLPLAFTLES